ncbi:MAG: ribonuclease P protein component [Patescibacteria group bacterium]|nr:ribonuclease P protein component [Patescibacteria group bacterium]
MLAKRFKLPIGEFPKRSQLVFRGQLLTIKKAPNQLEHPRVGVLVSKRINPKASTRNSLKRTIYDTLKEKLPVLPTALDLLVVVEAPIIEIDLKTKQMLSQDLDRGLGTLSTK